MSIEFPRDLGNIVYEYDYFCLAEGTPLLVKDIRGRIFLKEIESFSFGDSVLSINEESGHQEWKKAVLTRKKAPSQLLRIHSQSPICVTDRHKMILPSFEEVEAGKLKAGQELLSLPIINLPVSREKAYFPGKGECTLDYDSGIAIGKSFVEGPDFRFCLEGLPYWAFDADVDFKKGLIRGWIEGHSYCPFRIEKVYSSLFCRGIHDIAKSVGVNIPIVFEENSSTIKFVEDLDYSFVAREEKKALISSTQITRIDSIPSNSEWVYDLSVVDNHNFAIGEIITHNSGSQVLVYFEHVLVDDCVRIGFNVQQQRKPIYGYASQYYNALAAGVVMVTGSFWIGFKEAAYIPVILKNLNDTRVNEEGDEFFSSPAMSTGATELSGRTDSLSLAGSASAAREGLEVERANVERLVEAASQDDQNATTARALTNVLTQLGALSDSEFEDYAEMFEDAIWYGGNSPADGRGDAFSENVVSGASMTFEQMLAFRRADQFPPFDILLTFGDMNTQAANHTVHRIVDVTITNTEFSGIEPTGEPIMVRYDYIARNVM